LLHLLKTDFGMIRKCRRGPLINIYLTDLGAKRLELLRELIPNAAVIGMRIVAPAIPITGAVGSPTNPRAIK
jgi:hypothetical protein